jgi:hypothetical protein
VGEEKELCRVVFTPCLLCKRSRAAMHSLVCRLQCKGGLRVALMSLTLI